MPANLPPQYHTLEAKLKTVETPEEKIAIYEELLAICPKHKGTEKLQKDLKTKIAKLKKESPKKSKKEPIYSIKKEGAGQVVIVGPTKAGKSSLLNALTNAKAIVSDYPFTTKVPQPAMMRYQNIQIQLIDTPPLSKQFSPGWLKAIYRESDGLLLLFDLSGAGVEKEIKELTEILEGWKLTDKKNILVGNKIDLPFSQENLAKLRVKYKIKPISALEGTGLEELKKEIFDLLEVVRVFTKSRNQPEPNFSNPFIFKKGEKLITLASQIHHDLLPFFKYAKLFKKDSPNPQIVGKDYVLEDGDIIEIHV